MGLRSYVYLADDNGEVHGFGPGDDVPEWARRKITNPDVWESGVGESEPPRHGAGSSREAWADYASSQGVEVSEDDSRDDIIAKVEG